MNKQLVVSLAVGVMVCAAVACVVLSLLPAVNAKPVAIGTFDKDIYLYEDSTIIYQDNLRIVWVMTTAAKFNYSDDKEYAGAMGRFAIDCSGHTAAFLEGITIDKKGKVIQHGTVPESKWSFIEIADHTPQYTLYRMLCAKHPMI